MGAHGADDAKRTRNRPLRYYGGLDRLLRPGSAWRRRSRPAGLPPLRAQSLLGYAGIGALDPRAVRNYSDMALPALGPGGVRLHEGPVAHSGAPPYRGLDRRILGSHDDRDARSRRTLRPAGSSPGRAAPHAPLLTFAPARP